MTESRKGRFITIEGGEGTGKSTLLSGLNAQLQALGLLTRVTREPGGTELAEHVRNLVLRPPRDETWSPLAEALLMNAARLDHLEKLIKPTLEEGVWVLCDRFADSTRAYQSAGGGVEMHVLTQMEQWVLETCRPDLTLILDVPAEIAMERRALRAGATDAFEDRPAEYHASVRQVFLDIAQQEPERCRLINANQAPETVCADALSAIQSAFQEEVVSV